MSIGIDIGKFSVKIVELEKTNDAVNVKNIGKKNLFDDLNKFDHDKISKSQIKACIDDLCNEMKIKPKKIKKLTSSLSGKLIDVRQISTLEMPDHELSVSLELEAKKHVPLDGTDAIIDYHLLGTNNEKLDQIDLILSTTTKNIISEHAELLKSCKMKPGIFDADPIAVSNIHQFSNELPEQGSDVLVNIGNSTTTVVVWGQNASFFTREIDIAGDKINKEIVRKYECDYSTAESKKNELGIKVLDEDNEKVNKEDTNEDANPISGIMIEEKTIYNELVDEIRKTLRFYMKNNNNSFFNTFYITGGSSLLPGLDEFIASNLNVKVELLDPFKKINNSNKTNNPFEYSIALGLALRGLDK
jgi:type IV pilus assembly protein PilM